MYVEADIELGRKHAPHTLEFHAHALNCFYVQLVEDASKLPLKTRSFERSGSHIEIFGDDGETSLLYGRPYLMDDGNCVLDVDGKPMKLWEISRFVLEDLIFTPGT